jgi:hypothetical protein
MLTMSRVIGYTAPMLVLLPFVTRTCGACFRNKAKGENSVFKPNAISAVVALSSAVRILLPLRFNDAAARGLAYVSAVPAAFDKFITAVKETGVSSADQVSRMERRVGRVEGLKGGRHDPRR